MTKKQEIKLFEDKKVRTVWDDEKEKWYFCVVDVVEALTDSKDPSDYIKKMKKRDPELSKGWGQIVTPLSVQTAGGKQKMNCAPREGIFRIIQSIPSPKAEPFKRWMAQVASQRIDQMQEHIVFRWMSLKSTIEYLGEWEMLYNPNFNCTEFDTIRNSAGSNNFVLSVKAWIERTGARLCRLLPTGRKNRPYCV